MTKNQRDKNGWRVAGIILVMLIANSCLGQTKYEKEDRVKASEVPAIARDFVDQLEFQNKIKWYIETGLERTSFEAKIKENKRKYSIEFSDDGTLEDIEIEIKFRSLSQTTQDIIESHFSSRFSKFKICKVQRQFIGTHKDLISTIRSGQLGLSVVTNYEIEVKGKVDGAYKEVEFLFNQEGEKLSEAIIVQKNTDHLEY